MFIDRKPQASQNSFRSSMRPRLEHCTPNEVRRPNLIASAINIQPLRGCAPLHEERLSYNPS